MRKNHGWTVRIAALGVALGTLATARSAEAQTQIKPYMLLIFDNSGSMDGAPLTQAKAAVTNMVSAAGDVIFGLERFQTSCTGCTSGALGARSATPTPDLLARAGPSVRPIPRAAHRHGVAPTLSALAPRGYSLVSLSQDAPPADAQPPCEEWRSG